MKRLIFLLLAVLLLSCGEAQLPDPAVLYEQIATDVELDEMYDLADEMLEDTLGITKDLYDSAVYMTPGTGISPEELIIIKTISDESAKKVEELLNNRLDYIKKSAENYLIEEMPIIERAMIRRDGLTVSFIVSARSEEIEAVFDRLIK